MKSTTFVQLSYLTVHQSPRPPNTWFNVVCFADAEDFLAVCKVMVD